MTSGIMDEQHAQPSGRTLVRDTPVVETVMTGSSNVPYTREELRKKYCIKKRSDHVPV